MTAIRRSAVLLLVLLWTASPAAQATPAQTGIVQLTKILQDPRRCDQALATLGVIADKELAPLLAGATASESEARRLVAMSAMARLGREPARPALLTRLRGDPNPMVQGKALALLLNLQAVEADDIRMALRLEDQHVRCLAARALVAGGSGYMATATLRELAAADEKKVAIGIKAMARLSLLAAGDTSQMAYLRSLIRHKKHPPELRELLAAQITRDKITAALPLARELAELAEDTEGKLMAYEAVSTASPTDASDLTQAIRASSSPVFQVRLLELLAVRPDAKAHLEGLAGQPGVLGEVVRFELARGTLDQATTEAAMKALADEQPVAVAYVLSRARKDVDQHGRKAACYIPALLKSIQLANPESANLTADHYRAGRAVAMLVDIGTPQALAAVKALLPGKFDNRTRAVALGLTESKNPAVCELAKPLLTSPYPELSWRAGMVLGVFADPAATDYLHGIVTHPDDYPDEKVVLAAWFLAKIEHVAEPAAVQLGQMLRTSAR